MHYIVVVIYFVLYDQLRRVPLIWCKRGHVTFTMVASARGEVIEMKCRTFVVRYCNIARRDDLIFQACSSRDGHNRRCDDASSFVIVCIVVCCEHAGSDLVSSLKAQHHLRTIPLAEAEQKVHVQVALAFKTVSYTHLTLPTNREV